MRTTMKQIEKELMDEEYSSYLNEQPIGEYSQVDYLPYEDIDIHKISSSVGEGFEVSSNNENSSKNNGGDTDYYKLDISWVECGDIIEARKMNYNQGNIFKAAFTFNIGRHKATSYERELNKIIWFANRELNRIKGNKCNSN